LLRDKVDLIINGEDSKLAKRQERMRKRKRNAARYCSWVIAYSSSSMWRPHIVFVLIYYRRAKKKYGLKDTGSGVVNSSRTGFCDGFGEGNGEDEESGEVLDIIDEEEEEDQDDDDDDDSRKDGNDGGKRDDGRDDEEDDDDDDDDSKSKPKSIDKKASVLQS
jgi:hypothetical protein